MHRAHAYRIALFEHDPTRHPQLLIKITSHIHAVHISTAPSHHQNTIHTHHHHRALYIPHRTLTHRHATIGRSPSFSARMVTNSTVGLGRRLRSLLFFGKRLRPEREASKLLVERNEKREPPLSRNIGAKGSTRLVRSGNPMRKGGRRTRPLQPDGGEREGGKIIFVNPSV